MKRIRKDRRRGLRGVSLVELAIVLGVASVIVGGVWIIGGQATSKGEQQRFSDILKTTVTNIRGVYAGKAYITSTNAATLMNSELIPMGAFPVASVIEAPFGPLANPFANAAALPFQSLYACGWKASGSTACDFSSSTANVPLFALEALIPAGSACATAVLKNAATLQLPGLIDVVINGHSALGSGQTLPPSLAWVETTGNCPTPKVAATSQAAVVDFVFRLVP